MKYNEVNFVFLEFDLKLMLMLVFYRNLSTY